MAIYRHSLTITAEPDEDIEVKVEHPDHGTTSEHHIDIPGPNDFDEEDMFSTVIGKGAELYPERTLIITKAGNTDESKDKVRIKYIIKGEVVNHENYKSEDPSPRIKITLKVEKNV